MLNFISFLLFVCVVNESATAENVAVEDESCQSWPNFSKLPIECCSVPELFSVDVKEKCLANCTRPNDLSFNTWCCTTQCIFDGMGLSSNGSFDREHAKQILPKAFEKADKIVKTLAGIVDKCDDKISATELKQDEGKSECTTLTYGYIYSCIHQELLKICPESKLDKECIEVKEFMEKCPNLSPPLKKLIREVRT